MARLLVLVAAVWLVFAGCEQDLQQRPTQRYEGNFRMPPAGGGGGGAGDAGVDTDGGISGRNVEGRVVAIEDLSEAPSRALGLPDRQVGGYDTEGSLVTTTSGANGAFLLESLQRTDPIYLSVSGDPPSFVSLAAARADGAIAPVIAFEFLAEAALTQAVELGVAVGHAFVWIEDVRGRPVSGLTAEVVSEWPVQGPFYATADPSQLSATGPTGAQGLVVLLNAVPGDLELSLFRAEDMTTTATITIPIADGVVTFTEFEVGL